MPSNANFTQTLAMQSDKVKFVFFIATILAFFISCGKFECVKSVAPEMVGEWAHLSANNGFHNIYIQENGRGYMYGQNDHGNNQDTQGRGWYISDDVLHFSRFQNKVTEDFFAIDQYPTSSDSVLELQFDTIPIGTKFMVLNGRTYRKLN